MEQRLIDANNAIERIQKKLDLSIGMNDLDKYGYITAMAEITQEPTVEAVKRGRWILHDVYCAEQYECSHCHKKYIEEANNNCDHWNYCPNCGAEMIR